MLHGTDAGHDTQDCFTLKKQIAKYKDSQPSEYNRPQKKAKFNQARKPEGHGKTKKEDLYAMVKQMVARANKQKKMKRKASSAIEDLESFNYSDPVDSENDFESDDDEVEESNNEESGDEISMTEDHSDEEHE